MKILVFIVFFSLLFINNSVAQIKVLSIEKLPIEKTHQWMQPKFSPDGRTIYYTSQSYTGIWAYSLETKKVEMITGSSSAGFGFAISDDGKQIAYRQTIWGPKQGERKQEIVLYNKETKERKVIAAGSDLSIPAFNTSTSKVAYLSTNKVYNVQKSSTSKPNVVLLGIDDKKIQLNIDGTKRNIDPFPDGSYIWPALSPDKTMIVAYEMTYGAFIADLNGTVQKLLGRKDGPVWTRCGKWIVYMDENDDGHKILSSEICAVSLDSGIEVKLTQPSSIIKLHPHCSPTEDKIVFNTSEGELHILKYQEEQK